jgi:pimeloyl-ACP methyl ester carboxylesterase
MNLARGLCFAGVLAAVAPGAGAQLATEACRLTAPWLPGVAAECGRLTVAENPAEAGGNSIELFVARVASLNAEPREDPLVIIAGGPGQAATEFYLSTRAAFEQVRRDRDILLLDQRGTGKSAPLSCPQANAATLETTDVAMLPALMRECLADLDADPRFYTTSVAVVDLDALREVLGLATWNLYGVSYGTRVAQHYLRRYPQHTRALILDGVVPSDVPLGPDIAVQAQRVLDQIVARCAIDSACAGRFPNLGAQIEALLTSLGAGAVTVALSDPLTFEPGTRLLTLEQFTSVIRLLSYSAQTAALLPLLIDAAHAGNFAPIAAQSQMISGELGSALSLPMHNAVVCTEDVPFFQKPPATQLGSTYLGTSLVEALGAACSVWPEGAIDADLRAPLQSERPVLLLSGEADPITPPEYGDHVLAGLVHARHLVGPGQGHGLAVAGCVPRLMRAFLENLDPETLDASCLEREQASPFFLDFSGPSP